MSLSAVNVTRLQYVSKDHFLFIVCLLIGSNVNVIVMLINYESSLFLHSLYVMLHLERNMYDVRAIVYSYVRVLHSVLLVPGQIVNVLLILLQALLHLQFYPCQACAG